MMYAMAAATEEWASPGAEVDVTVLLFKEGDFWVAIGLENGLAAQGDSPEGAKGAFRAALEELFAANLAEGRWPVMREADPDSWARVDEAASLDEEEASVGPGGIVSGSLTFAFIP